jgi:hypothetical protein
MGNISSGNRPLHANYRNLNVSHTMLIQRRSRRALFGFCLVVIRGRSRRALFVLEAQLPDLEVGLLLFSVLRSDGRYPIQQRIDGDCGICDIASLFPGAHLIAVSPPPLPHVMHSPAPLPPTNNAPSPAPVVSRGPVVPAVRRDTGRRRQRRKLPSSPQSTPEAEQPDALARILRTEAAVSGVSRKAAAARQQSTRLWPRAVLEALDSAVAACRWESALEVPPPPPSALPTSLPTPDDAYRSPTFARSSSFCGSSTGTSRGRGPTRGC